MLLTRTAICCRKTSSSRVFSLMPVLLHLASAPLAITPSTIKSCTLSLPLPASVVRSPPRPFAFGTLLLLIYVPIPEPQRPAASFFVAGAVATALSVAAVLAAAAVVVGRAVPAADRCALAQPSNPTPMIRPQQLRLSPHPLCGLPG